MGVGVLFADEVVDEVETEVVAAAGTGQDLVSQLDRAGFTPSEQALQRREVAAGTAKLLDPPLLTDCAVPSGELHVTTRRPAGL